MGSMIWRLMLGLDDEDEDVSAAMRVLSPSAPLELLICRHTSTSEDERERVRAM